MVASKGSASVRAKWGTGKALAMATSFDSHGSCPDADLYFHATKGIRQPYEYPRIVSMALISVKKAGFEALGSTHLKSLVTFSSSWLL